MKGGSVYICNVNKLCITAQRRHIRVHFQSWLHEGHFVASIFGGRELLLTVASSTKSLRILAEIICTYASTGMVNYLEAEPNWENFVFAKWKFNRTSGVYGGELPKVQFSLPILGYWYYFYIWSFQKSSSKDNFKKRISKKRFSEILPSKRIHVILWTNPFEIWMHQYF